MYPATRQPSKLKLVLLSLIYIPMVLFSPLLWNLDNYVHVRDWPSSSATVLWMGEKCEMRYAAGKNSVLVDVIDCSDVKSWRKAHRVTVRGRERYFRSSREDYVEVELRSPFGRPIALVREDVASAKTLSVGDIVELHYDPKNPRRVDRAYAWYEYWFSLSYYAILIWFVVWLATQRREFVERLRRLAEEERENRWPSKLLESPPQNPQSPYSPAASRTLL
jgi:hypothetical protein